LFDTVRLIVKRLTGMSRGINMAGEKKPAQGRLVGL
jgi:hypothetical protein